MQWLFYFRHASMDLNQRIRVYQIHLLVMFQCHKTMWRVTEEVGGELTKLDWINYEIAELFLEMF